MASLTTTVAQAASRVLAPSHSSPQVGAPQLQTLMWGDEVLTHILPSANQDRAKLQHQDRAVVSHLRAQADGIARDVERDCDAIWTTNTLDAATMWISRPPPRNPSDMRPETLIERRARELDKKLKKRSKNVHVPVLNLLENVFVCAADNRVDGALPALTYASRVHTPAIPLPNENTGTVRDRWAKFSVLSAQGVGEKVASQRLKDAMATSTAWKSMYVTGDNAGVNGCIHGLEQRCLIQQAGPPEADDETTVDSLPCISHSACLTAKPVLERFEGLASALVTLGHCLESWRVQEDLEAKINGMVTAPGGFDYKECNALPADIVQHAEANAKTLQLTAPACDLSQDQVDFILAADNGSWDALHAEHWCVNGACPLRPPGASFCGEAHARRNACHAASMAAGGGFQAPLKYRWKGFDRATAYCWRATAYHNYLPRALGKMYPDSAVKKAENDILAAALRGEDADFKVKAQVRGGKAKSYFTKDAARHYLKAGIVMNSPGQGAFEAYCSPQFSFFFLLEFQAVTQTRHWNTGVMCASIQAS